ncbi:hypothetical protein DOK67_0000095 [Enterococcus sp. DIV0212c]|uniref:hypothetical protein n=1 Tax=Enterococcus sp. DIV0212c TaxID=2230867 RepID=UPI001A9B9F82|nr:hypothetical protein [Enterococcus sp. DIV0212c]MBO1353946.1 hypothetical protein [Enterococcus sp. DIV0212c]
MYNLYYVVKDSSIDLIRNKGATFFKGTFIFLYTLTLTILLHLLVTTNHLETIEKENKLLESNSLDYFVQTNSSDHLITLLVSLKNGFIIFTISLFLFGIAYLFIYFQKALLLNKEELVTKKMLGASAIRVTSELFLDSVLLIIPCIILGIIVAEYFYASCFFNSTFWLARDFYAPSYFIVYVDLPLIGLFSLVLICQFFYLKQKITNL